MRSKPFHPAGAILPACLLALAAGAPARAEPAPDPPAIPRGPGLCVVVGCAEGRVLVELAADRELLVHGLASDRAALEKAREFVARRGLYGRVSVELRTGASLPYADNLVNVLIAEDVPALLAGGISVKELLRVVCPGGLLLARGGEGKDLAERLTRAGAGAPPRPAVAGGWVRAVKARPAGMDEWTHRWHDADGACVSGDTLMGPPAAVRWLAGPPLPAWGWRGISNSTFRSGSKGAVSAGGRVFFVSASAPRNLIAVRKDYCLLARDAYNGLGLWSRPLDAYADPAARFRPGAVADEVAAHLRFVSGSRLPVRPEQLARERRREQDAALLGRTLVAIGPRLYGIIARRVVSLDAATGKIVTVYEKLAAPAGRDGTPRLIVRDGILILAEGRSVRAYDTAGGRRLWKLDGIAAAGICAGGGRVYCLVGGRRGSTGLVALSPADGRKLWRTNVGSLSHAVSPAPPAATAPARRPARLKFRDRFFYRDGRVMLICGALGKNLYPRGVHAMSAADGREIWCRHVRAGGKGVHVSPGDGLVWMTYQPASARSKKARICEGLDPATGQVRRSFKQGVGPSICRFVGLPPSTERYFINTRPIAFMDRRDGKVHPSVGARHACGTPPVVANGLLYLPPQGCACVKTAIRSYVAYASAEKAPPAGPAGRLEKGPAFGRPAPPGPARVGEWPTYRHDNRRSASARVAPPADLEVLWQVRLAEAAAPGRNLAAEWRVSNLTLTDPLTAPVIAGGTVFVGAINSHRLVALDAGTGRRRWSFVAGGRIDAPPTLHQALCLFGSRDGWAYCLAASDGRLVWRLRAAPDPRRIVAWGQLESPAPVVGGVTVEGGRACFAAGRSGTVGPGVVFHAVNPRDGTVLHRRKGSPRKGPIWPDLFVSDGAGLLLGSGAAPPWRRKKTPRLGPPFLRAEFAATNTSWRFPGISRDNSARRVGGVQSYRGLRGRIAIGRAGKDGKVFLSGLITGRDRRLKIVRDLFAFQAGRPEPLWSVKVPEPIQIEAMILAGDVLFAAGTTDRFRRKQGFLLAISAGDGRELRRIELPAPPTAEGLAAARSGASDSAPARLYVTTQDGTLLCFGKK